MASNGLDRGAAAEMPSEKNLFCLKWDLHDQSFRQQMYEQLRVSRDYYHRCAAGQLQHSPTYIHNAGPRLH